MRAGLRSCQALAHSWPQLAPSPIFSALGPCLLTLTAGPTSQAANVHAILESVPLVEGVIYQLRMACNVLEDLDESLKVFDFKLRWVGRRQQADSLQQTALTAALTAG